MAEILPKKTGFIMINNECDTCPPRDIQLLQTFDGPIDVKVEKDRIIITRRKDAEGPGSDFTFVPSKAGMARIAKAATEKKSSKKK